MLIAGNAVNQYANDNCFLNSDKFLSIFPDWEFCTISDNVMVILSDNFGKNSGHFIDFMSEFVSALKHMPSGR